MKRVVAVIILIVVILPLWAEDFGSPLDSYTISSDFGYRQNPMGGLEGNVRLHKGVDLVGPYNSVIKAVKSGVIVEHWPPPNGFFKGHPIYGGLIVIEHNDGVFTLYAHFKDTFIKEGQIVKKGEILGIQGSSGISTGDHLHFEVITDPLSFIVKAE
jgi:murein DD-endopeptidase MepM/ murein hydrolase activator NlpD